MPFSRYQIRNEFSLADPELYKSADKDDPEALLEGVAMAGLVGVLRQLGDLAEFAAEIFHGLHEEVMVTAARGHDLLVRVQQVESDFPSIERAFLSQTGHSAFFSSSGISWHPNLQTEQNLITKGDLPRFVMDSYEESRGPPRLFLLDKFDVAGAGACLKRYTDPSFYKVEASSYEMMSAEAQRDKKIRKTKKKGSRLKNGETPEVFQPSHVKLHQLLLEERVQNGASEPARRVKLKKREIKFPFDTENGKGYMEKLLSSPPEDKLVHEVPVGYSELEPLEDRMANSPMQNGGPYESPTVDKTVSREHMDPVLENSSIELQPDDIEDKHISVDVEQKEAGFEDGYRSDDVASETENYMDALTTMESEVETDVELRVAISDPMVKQEIEPIQSQFSESQSVSDDESSPIMNKITSFSYSDTTSTSPENMSPHGINSPAFASTEIPFRPRVSPNEVSDNCIEVRDDESLPVDNGAIIEESTSKESDSSEILSTNCVNVNSPTRKEEIEIDPEDIIASIVDNEDYTSNSSLVISHDLLDGKSEPAEANVAYSSEDETVLKDRETVLFDSQESNEAITGDEQELKVIEPASVNSEAKDSIPVSVPDDVDSNGIQHLSTCEDMESKGREIETVDLEKNEDNGVSTTEELGDNGPVINESGAGLNSGDSVEKESSDHPDMQILDSIFHSFSVTDNDLDENDDNDEIKSQNQVDQIDKLETHVDQFETDDSQNHLVDTHSDSDPIDHESYSLEQGENFQDHEEPSMADLSQPSTHINRSGFNMIPPLAPSNMEKMPPLPPLPPMQWRMGKLPSDSPFSNLGDGQHDLIHQSSPASLDLNENATNEKSDHDVKDLSSEEDGNLVASLPGGGQHGIHQFPPASQVRNEINTYEKLERDYEDLNTEEDGKLDVPSEVNAVKFEKNIVPQPPQYNNETDEELERDYEDLNTEEDGKLDVPTEVNAVKCEENIVPQPPQHDNKTDEKPEHDSEDLNTVEDGKLDVLTEMNAVKVAENIVPQAPQCDNKTDEKSDHDYEDLNTEEDGKLDVPTEVNAVKFEEQIVPHPPQYVNKTDEKSEQDYEDLNTEEDGKLDVPTEVNVVKFEEQIVPQPPQYDNKTDEKSEQDYEDLNAEEDGKLDVPTEVNAVKFEEQIVPQPPQYDNKTDEKSDHDSEDLNTEEDGKLDPPTEVNVLKFEENIVPQPPQYREQSENVLNSGREIIRPLSTSVLPLIDSEKPNGIRPMRIQRPRSPLIDAVAAHDKSKLKKASERAMPPVPKEEERDTLLEQIRAKSFNLKPAVQTRPSIQGPKTNLRVAAILEKANAIRQAFAGSDDDEDDSDSWSDS